MRILHVIHSVDPRSGGPSHALRALVRVQVATGHDVGVLATTTQSSEPWAPEIDYRSAVGGDEAFDGTEVFLGRAFGRRRPWSRYAYSPECKKWLHRRLGDPRRRPAVVHVHGLFSHLTFAAAAACRSHGVPYILRPAGGLNTAMLARGTRWAKRLLHEFFLDRDLSAAARVHAMSNREARELRRITDARVITIPHGVHLPSEGEPARAAAGPPVVLFLSRLHEKKRPQWLLEAYARIRGDVPETRFMFAGTDDGAEGDVRETAGRLGLSDRVSFAGFVQGETKRRLFECARVFALPSVDENFGVAVVEAMAHRVPVLVTPGVATSTYVEQSGGGIVAPDSLDGVAQGLKTLLNASRDDIGGLGRNYVAEHLSWPGVAARLEEVYLSTISESQPARVH